MPNDPFELRLYSAENLLNQVIKREGEIKIGETVHFGAIQEQTNYVILGIAENIGPQANNGLSGSEKAFGSFLTRFLNMQSNRHINGNEICILGSIEQNTAFSTVQEARNLVEKLDDLVTETLLTHCNEKTIPILIGGGHNNALPLIEFSHRMHKKSIQVVNMDPHADCRPLEGRHSGNSFSYAFDKGFISAYNVLGLHKAYNSEYILNYLEEKKCFHHFFEDYIESPQQFDEDLHLVFSSLANDRPCGIELDMDAIQHMPSSAYTPSGITLEQARKYVRKFAHHSTTCYLHLPEASPQNSLEEKIVGKSLAYLVWDFIQTRQQFSRYS